MSIFNFELEKMLESQIYREDGSFAISWFWLASSYYHMDLGEVKLYEFTPHLVEKYKMGKPYLNEYFGDHLNILFEALEDSAQPMPVHLYKYIDTFEKQNRLAKYIMQKSRVLQEKIDELKEKDDSKNFYVSKELAAEQDGWYKLFSFIWRGAVDNIQIRKRVDLYLIHVEDKMIVRYDFSNRIRKEKNRIWMAKKGEKKFPYVEFIEDFEKALINFFKCMDVRVQEAVAYFSEKDYSINQCEDYYIKFPEKRPQITGAQDLIQEHEQRRKDYFERLEKIKNGIYNNPLDWVWIEEQIKQLSFEGKGVRV